MTTNSEPQLTQQVEWFHQFAKQSVAQLAAQATEKNRALFRQYVIACLPDHDPPEGQSPEEFARNVLELRENESRWNQALMSALIRAEDLHKEQGWQRAVATLQSFAKSCPWKLFEEVALNQASHYEPH